MTRSTAASLSFLLAAACGSPSPVLEVNLGATAADGATLHTGGPGGSEYAQGAAPHPVTALATAWARVSGGTDPVAVSSLSLRAPEGSKCTVKKAPACMLGVCTFDLEMKEDGACVVYAEGGSSDGDAIAQCVMLVLTKAGSGMFEAENQRAFDLCNAFEQGR